MADEDGCHFRLNHDLVVIDEGSDDGTPMTVKLTVTNIAFGFILVRFQIKKNQIIIFAICRRSVLTSGRAHPLVLAPGQHSSAETSQR